MRKHASTGRRRGLLLAAPAALSLILLGSAPAHAAASSGGQEISVFTDRNVTVAVTGGTATAINQCVSDATDGVIQTQRNSCQQAASAGNLVDVTSITVYRSKNTSITVTGGTATAINRCVSDATDGVIQTQRNSCQQAASAGNVVIVAAIKISASKNTKITVTGGSSTAVDECINNASAAPSQDQENACVQVADAENVVDVGAIDITDSKNITIDVTGGSAVTVFTCTSHATGRTTTGRDTCTEIAAVGTLASLGNIRVADSKNVTITLDGTVVTTIRKTAA